MTAKEYLESRKVKDGEHLTANSQDVYYPKTLVEMLLREFAQAQVKEVVQEIQSQARHNPIDGKWIGFKKYD